MTIIFNNHKFKYEIESVCKMFFAIERFDHEYNSNINSRNEVVLTRLKKGRYNTRLLVVAQFENILYKSAYTCSNDIKNYTNECERLLCMALYNVLTQFTKMKLSWGIMTGIRPVKQIHYLTERGYTKEQVKQYFLNDFVVSEAKYTLCNITADNQEQILKKSHPNEYSLYVSIPFCPTRCSYCSFVSSSIATKKAKDLMQDYLLKLCEEIKYTAQMLKHTDKILKSVYIGGGTPTTLSAEQLRLLCDTISQNFDLSNIFEYTIEAGRVDTIDEEKLNVMKMANVDRISVNPQSFNDEVLAKIGRSHSSKDTVKIYELARKIGFKTINMDFIAGLPNDDLNSFKNTINTAIKLAPQNITVHALTLKRSSTLYDDENFLNNLVNPENDLMIKYAEETLMKNAYNPYYLYRQKNTVQNLENVGYAKSGYECAYNIYIMDEIHSIVAVGAGGVTKIVGENKTNIDRSFNYKYPFEYANNFQEILNRKKSLKCL